MFEALETGSSLDLILALQDARNGALEALVTALDLLGGELFFIAFLALIYWAFSKKYGLRMYFALMLISLAVFALKDLLGRPRPYQISELVMPVFEEEGFGIPSGHTAITVMVWGYFAYWIRKTWVSALAVIYMVMQGVGRMIAGVHFPQDVIAGLLLGLVLLLIYIRTDDVVAAWWQRQALVLKVIAAIVIAGAGLLLSSDAGVLTIIGLLSGGILGIALEARAVSFMPHGGSVQRVVQYVLGLVLSIALLFGLDVLFGEGEPAGLLRVIRYALVAIFALGIWPWVSLRVGLLQKYRRAYA